ncbi:MAG: hypothetical protein LBU16_09690 [Treponema sp.]|nr:hypothetical protein [Treponema sp.]
MFFAAFLFVVILTACPNLTGPEAAEKQAAAFKEEHTVVLTKTVDSIALGDENPVNAVLAEYNALDEDVKAFLSAEKALLDTLKAKIGELKAATPAGAAEAFQEDHAAVLAKTVDTVFLFDETAVNDALAAYNALAEEARALLSDKKALLDDLQGKIEELKAQTPQEAVAAFKTAHADVLAKTVNAIVLADETAVSAALNAYNALSTDAKLLLNSEKARLDNLKTKIEELKAAQTLAEAAAAFKAAHADVLAKTVNAIVLADETAVNAALAAYNALAAGAQTLLSAEKARLDNLHGKIEELKAATPAGAADAFKAAHADVLKKTVYTVALADETAVNAALSAYNALAAGARALLSDEYALLGTLHAKIEEFKFAQTPAGAAAAFKAAHAAALALEADAVALADETAVSAALAAYNALDAQAQALLLIEKALLDNLQAKIEELQVEADVKAFKADHEAALAMEADAVAIADETAVSAALAAHNALSKGAQAQLTAEKAKLTDLLAVIARLASYQETADAFTTTYAGILAKTTETVTASDLYAANVALGIYGNLIDAIQDLLSAEKTLLDTLKAKAEELAAQAAEAFKEDHSAVLAKTAGNIVLADATAVNDALAAYNGLPQAAQALLTDEKALLDSLKGRVNILGQGSIATVVYPTDAADNALAGGSITIYKTGGNKTHTLAVNGVFDSYRWQVDGSARGSDNAFTLNAGDYALGTHQLSLEVTLNGGVYSKSGSFTVAR